MDSTNDGWGPDDPWGSLPTWDSGGFVPYTGGAAGATGDIATSTGAATPGQDQYAGFWQNLVSSVVGYGIAKDARASGVTPVTTSSGQTLYRPAPAAPGGLAVLLLVGLAVAYAAG